MTLRIFTTTALSVSTLAFAGCATTQPPLELIQARDAYSAAEHSNAAHYNPAAIHEAKVALDQAESMFTEDAASLNTRDAAYVAMRRAERAKVECEIASLQARKDEAMSARQQSQAKAAEKMQGELASTRTQLAQATAARQAAEERAKQAMSNLLAANAAAVAESPRGTVVTLASDPLFRSDAATFTPAAQPKLDLIVAALKDQGDHKILVEGHTDARGSDARNMSLTKQRADAVANYLTTHGVAIEKVSSAGLGATRPVASNDTPEGRSTNRRVEITIERNETR